MSLEEKLLQDYKDAMLSKDAIKSSCLSFLRADLKYTAIDKKKNKLEDSDIISVIKKQVKSHQDSIDQFKKGNRMDLVEKETKELEILKSYLPKELPEEELKKIVLEVISAKSGATIKDMGVIIKEVMARTKGAADGKMVSDLVRQKLAGS